MTDDPDPRLGTVLDERYRILESLSSGAMGAVYRAERLQLGREVAIKFLHPHFAQHPDFIRRFEQEALTMSRLNHPNCVSVIDFGLEDSPFIVMDFVTGPTLVDVLDDGPVPPARAFAILRQLLGGLEHAHRQGIVHRDVKPANIVLSTAAGTGDHVHILDFGLAKLRDVDMSTSGIVVGTPSYMSPEQASYKQLDGRADVYAAGVLLFELLTGEKPFRADEAFDIIRMHLEAEPPALRDRRPGGRFPDELEAIVRRALSKSPDERYQSALAFAEALAEVAGPETAPAPARAAPPQSPIPRGPPPPPRGRSERPAPDSGGAPSSTPSGSTIEIGATMLAASPGSSAGVEAASVPAVPEPRPVTAVSEVPAGAATPGPRRVRPRRRSAAGWLLLVPVALAIVWGAFGAPGLPGAWRGELASRADSLAGRVSELVGGAGQPERRVTSIDEARRLAAAGEREAALRGLHQLRRDRPRDPDVLVAIGETYFEGGPKGGWWSEGLAAFTKAAQLDVSPADREVIARRAIEALERDETRGAARVLLVEHLGRAAIPHLREAARAATSPREREDIRELVRRTERHAARADDHRDAGRTEF